MFITKKIAQNYRKVTILELLMKTPIFIDLREIRKHLRMATLALQSSINFIH